MSGWPWEGRGSNDSNVKERLYLLLAYAIFIIAPYYAVYNLSTPLSDILSPVFSGLRKYSELTITVVAVILAFGFYWLKLMHQAIYGAIEIFIAQLTIASFVQRLKLDDPGSKTLTVLGIFTGIYITIRGLDNIQKWIEGATKGDSTSSQVIEWVWYEYFAKDIIGPRILFFVLMGVAIGVSQYSVMLFVICTFVVLAVQDIVIYRRKLKRQSHPPLPRI